MACEQVLLGVGEKREGKTEVDMVENIREGPENRCNGTGGCRVHRLRNKKLSREEGSLNLCSCLLPAWPGHPNEAKHSTSPDHIQPPPPRFSRRFEQVQIR